MSDNYCEFELKTLNCIECGKITPFLGTCKDRVFCSKCRQFYLDNTDDYRHKALIRMAEEDPYWDSGFTAREEIDKEGRYK